MQKHWIACLLTTLCFWQGSAALSAQAASEEQLRQTLSRQANNPEAQLELANLLLERLRKQWLQRDLNASGEAFQKQADSFERQSQEIKSLYEKVIALQPRQVEARVNLAEVYFVFLNQYDQAEILLHQALEIEPDNAKALIAMAEFEYFFQADRKKALKRIEDALAKFPGHPDLSITLADLLTGTSQQAADFARAHEVLDQALKLQPQHSELRYMLGSIWYREAVLDSKQLNHEKAQKALDIYLDLIKTKPDTDLVQEAAQIAQSMGQLPLARHILEQGLIHFPQDARLKLMLADLWLQQAAKSIDAGEISPEVTQAENIYLQLLTPGPMSQLSSGQQVQLYYNLGLLSQLKAQVARANPKQALIHYREAEKMFRQALAIFDRINIINAPLQQDLAKTLEAIGQIQAELNPAQAVEAYKEACSLKLESSCNWLKQQGIGP